VNVVTYYDCHMKLYIRLEVGCCSGYWRWSIRCCSGYWRWWLWCCGGYLFAERLVLLDVGQQLLAVLLEHGHLLHHALQQFLL